MNVVLSCEHASAAVPRAFRQAAIPDALRRSHHGWDPGALTLARELAALGGWPLLAGRMTRLLIDLNRSEHHPRLCSQYSRGLPDAQRARLLAVYRDYRQQVLGAVEAAQRGGACLHLSVHSFTPELDPAGRDFDLGLLYDPARAGERALCRRWQAALRERGFRVRRNAPYRGVADGHTRALRNRFAADAYLGVELELNQALAGGRRGAGLAAALFDSCPALPRGAPPERTGA